MTGPLLFVAKFTISFMKGDDGMIKNKIYATALLGIGVASMVLAKEATVLVLICTIALPLFFSKREWIY